MISRMNFRFVPLIAVIFLSSACSSTSYPCESCSNGCREDCTLLETNGQKYCARGIVLENKEGCFSLASSHDCCSSPSTSNPTSILTEITAQKYVCNFVCTHGCKDECSTVHLSGALNILCGKGELSVSGGICTSSQSSTNCCAPPPTPPPHPSTTDSPCEGYCGICEATCRASCPNILTEAQFQCKDPTSVQGFHCSCRFSSFAYGMAACFMALLLVQFVGILYCACKKSPTNERIPLLEPGVDKSEGDLW